MQFDQTSSIIITCSNRLSVYLKQEVEILGFTVDKIFKTGISLTGTISDAMWLNMNLRCASQVLYSVHTFKAAHPQNVYDAVSQLPWEDWIPATGYFAITSNVTNDFVDNNLFVNVKVKDAIADRFRQQTGERPNSGPSLQQAVFHLYWKEDEAELFLDTSGETLSKHGYRKIPGKAPMLESLAAAVLLATAWQGQTTFVNPMCGSGTLAIEAALLATNRSPGLLRNNYSFMHVLGYDEDEYMKLYNRLEQQVKSLPDAAKIIASDLSEDAVNISKINAGIAGVEDLISFEQCDFADTTLPTEHKGIVLFNPEYGDRLGEEAELEGTYKRMGDYLKQKCKGYEGFIFTGNLELAKKIGLKPKRRIEFYNGKIDCRLLQYELYEGSRAVK